MFADFLYKKKIIDFAGNPLRSMDKYFYALLSEDHNHWFGSICCPNS